jgi:glucose-6-phosphate isomerase
MRLPEPRMCQVNVETGLMANASGHYKKTYDDLAGLYADSAAFAALLAQRAGQVAYEVTQYIPENAGRGDMIFGLTRMEPGKVGDEYFLTRGHIHARANRPEVYYGQKGTGLMILESPEGDVRICEVGPQSICYVPPYWIHRSVNVGLGDFVMHFSYPADSGQDYGIIERSGGMRARIVDDGTGGWKQVANPAWRARSAEEVARVMATADV